MELHDENSFKIRGYQNAIFNLDKMDVELASMSLSDLEGLQGVGKGIASTIKELAERGSSEALDEYFITTPEGIIELLDIKGIGPKKIKVLWKELGIESGHELKEAANTGLVAGLKGFGDKTQQKIIEALEFKEANANKLHFSEAEELAKEVLESIEKLDSVQKAEVTGELRRQLEIANTLELLVATKEIEKFEKALDDHTDFKQDMSISGPTCWRGYFKEHQIIVEFYFAHPDHWVRDQFLKTGSQPHISAVIANGKSLRDMAYEQEYRSEEELYGSLNLAYVVPELREGTFEIEKAKSNDLPELAEMEDLKGILHNHSTYSDGKHSLKQMAEYCKELGYEYLGICDHSKSAFYANGLEEDRIVEQHKEIEELNKGLAPFKIFKGIESDILNDGSLDYSDDVLESFDFIVASVHSVLNMNKQKATQRLMKAIENPYTTILGHPTGRLLLRRAGYAIDHKKVIDHCAKHNVIIEINANPWRLDLDWRWVNYAISQGVKLSINPDAHKMEGYHDMRYGLLVGRKGGLTADMTFNALSQEEMEKHFIEKKAKATANA